MKLTPITYFFENLFVGEAIRLTLRYMSGEAGISTIWGLGRRAGNSDQKPSQNQSTSRNEIHAVPHIAHERPAPSPKGVAREC
jgi:hypothetical protein